MRTPRKKTRSFWPAILGVSGTFVAIGIVIAAIGFRKPSAPPSLPLQVDESIAARRPTPFQPIEIVTASKFISVGEAITTESVTFTALTPDRIPPDAIRNLKQIDGKVAIAPIPNGYPITEQVLGAPIVILPSAIEPVSEPAAVAYAKEREVLRNAGVTEKTR